MSNAEQQRRRDEKARDDDPERQAVARPCQLTHHAFEALQIEDDAQLTALDGLEGLAEQIGDKGGDAPKVFAFSFRWRRILTWYWTMLPCCEPHKQRCSLIPFTN